MPKVLLYIVKQIMWMFLFWNTDINENRAHVHVGKKGSMKLCKIWLEPEVEVETKGDLTDAQVKEIVEITKKYHVELLHQWEKFKKGEKVTIIKVTK